MSDSLDNLEGRLQSFRPWGEALALERALGALAEVAAADVDLRCRLLASPRAVLAEYGLSVPASVRLEVLEEKPGSFHLVLPIAEEREHDYSPAALQILKRARQDSVFEASLLKQPRSIFEATLGYSLPAAMSIGVHKNTPDQFYLVLPPEKSSGELSNADLDMVAGGTSPFRLDNPFRVNNGA
jgi:hypothetical protein